MNRKPIDYVIKFSGGNDSIALVQWCVDKGLRNMVAVYNNTGWASEYWPERIYKLNEWLKSKYIEFVELESEGMFNLAMRKKSWPGLGSKFCTTYLKIVPYQKWVEEVDPDKDAVCLVGIRREESQRRSNWPEWIEESETDGGRSLWSPLVNFSSQERDELIYRAGWSPLPHRSQECYPCVFANKDDIKLLTSDRVDEIEDMESAMGFTKNGKPRTFFRPKKRGGAVGIRKVVDWANSDRGKYDPDQNLLFGCDSGFCGG